MRYYQIMHVPTGKFVIGVEYRRKMSKTSGKLRKTGKPSYHLATDNGGNYLSISQVNYHIAQIMQRDQLKYELDNLKIIAYAPVEVPATIKVSSIKKRLESVQIMNKLRYG